MTAQYGAAETMAMHGVLSCEIDGINQIQLYRPHVKDQQLMQILDHQLQFMATEYNNMVQAVSQHGAAQAIPYRTPKNVTPKYGLHQPATETPNQSANDMDDRDVASGIMGLHKSLAAMKLRAALESADPQLRRMLQQGAINCSEQAYEVWDFMNQKGYYQVPTMKEMTTNTIINSYGQAGQTNQMNPMAPFNQMGGSSYQNQLNPPRYPQ